MGTKRQNSAAMPNYRFAPGMVGEIAEYLWARSPQPFEEAVLGAAIALYAGIVGRAYNVSGMGLNHYLAVIAKTGIGKTSTINDGIDELISRIGSMEFGVKVRRGPGSFTSAQGIQKALAKMASEQAGACCLSLQDDFSEEIKRLCKKTANPNDAFLRRMILVAYSKSGGTKTLGTMDYSDITKNVPDVIAPAWSIIGNATPDKFYQSVTEESIADGFLTRFSILEYKGLIPADNPDHKSAVPSEGLIEHLKELITYVHHKEAEEGKNQTYKWFDVPLDEEAQSWDEDLKVWCRNEINKHNKAGEEHLSALWTRVREKTLRLAALIAVGVDYKNPVITGEIYEWAQEFVMRSHDVLVDRFKDGEFGEESLDTMQRKALIDFLIKYTKELFADTRYDAKRANKFSLTPEMWNCRLPLLSYRYVAMSLQTRKCFKDDKRGAGPALQSQLMNLVKTGDLLLIDPENRKGPAELVAACSGRSAVVYALTDRMIALVQQSQEKADEDG